MVKRNSSRKNRSRKNRRNGGGLFSRVLYNPVHQALGLVGNTVSAVTNTTRNVARKGINGVNRVGKSITSRANSTVRNLVGRSRKNRSRKNRSRKNRKNRNRK
jgi:hypothetical protein